MRVVGVLTSHTADELPGAHEHVTDVGAWLAARVA
jgi:hypothetical protein